MAQSEIEKHREKNENICTSTKEEKTLRRVRLRCPSLFVWSLSHIQSSEKKK